MTRQVEHDQRSSHQCYYPERDDEYTGLEKKKRRKKKRQKKKEDQEESRATPEDTCLVVVGGEVKGIIIPEQLLVLMVCVLRRVFVGAVPVVGERGSGGGGEPAWPFPPVTFLKQAAHIFQLLGTMEILHESFL